MALKRYRYKPYSSRRKNQKRQRLLSLIILIAVIAGVIYAVKSCGNEEPAPVDDPNSALLTDYESFVERDRQSLPGSDEEAETAVDMGPVVPADSGAPIQPEPEPEITAETAESRAKFNQILNEATSHIQAGRIIAARDILNEALKLEMLAADRNELKHKVLAKLSDKWLFSSKIYPGDDLTGAYKVQSGDFLSVIAQKYNVPHELLMRINGIKRAENLRAGATIKVINGPFNARIDSSTLTMDVYLQNTYVKSYPVGLGAPANPTPTGLWRVAGGGKHRYPSWTDPKTGQVLKPDHPDYPLGPRWIAIEGLDENTKGKEKFGIHGTNDPQSIGKFMSDGCVRMLNEDVKEFYDLVVPRETRIQIMP